MTPEHFVYALVLVLFLGVIALLGINGYYPRFAPRTLAVAPPEPQFVSFWSRRYGLRLARIIGPAPSGRVRLAVVGHPPGVTVRRGGNRIEDL